MQQKLTFLRLNYIPIVFVITSALFYWSFAYDLHRADTIKLLILYVALFFLFYKLVQRLKHNFKFLAWLAFGFRVVFILAIPNLSQDFYRFIWDGRLILEGINPYLYTPESFIAKGVLPVEQAQELYDGMGTLNGSHFTNYPPLNQLCFVIAGLLAGKSILGSVVVMRLLIIAADFGTLYFSQKLLERLKLPTYHIFWYVFNPFIIIELTGNLHFEGVMIFFLIWSIYLLHLGKWQWSALLFGCSASIKLIPLLFLPVLIIWFIKQNVIASETRQSVSNNRIATSQVPRNDNWISFTGMTKFLVFVTIVCLTIIVSFMPFSSIEFITNFTETTALWFNNFEFNASIFYVVRTVGYWFVSFNIIPYYGWFIAVVIPILIFFLIYKRKHKNTTLDIIITILFALSLYYFTATTVHPWYITTLLALSIFTRYKFTLAWSFIAILSYTAYSQDNYTENLWLVTLEYILVYGVFIWEVLLKKPIKI
ncbi:glycosyltransferase 87 family protein [Yeosuana sp. MJ-SS3]|jgi:hypothetical protein|uniref:Glycosyltransferase 87 family protein n=1 Tax=Gilvirhabdus luticola TaxID=3079858 RepID=A0ABU3U471_9FLAO|nr:glycosyltransferase 87 family protein [Yeosuana sp. MJ-SS3]MDU8885146.1 glycosyltransferase 87 family protein [Yeosuana sp. MJ-SS3]